MTHLLNYIAGAVVFLVMAFFALPWIGGAIRDSRNRWIRDYEAAADDRRERAAKFRESLRPPPVVIQIPPDVQQAYEEELICADLAMIQTRLELASERLQLVLAEVDA